MKEDVVEDNSINFDRAVFAVTNKTGKMYIVDAVDPEKYIEANTSTHIDFVTNEGTSIYIFPVLFVTAKTALSKLILLSSTTSSFTQT